MLAQTTSIRRVAVSDLQQCQRQPKKATPGKKGQQRLPRDVRKKLRALRAKGEDDDAEDDTSR
eukprot:3042409-Rhodomonas_salina.2